MRYETLRTIAIPDLLAVRGRMTETYGLAAMDETAMGVRVLYSIQGPGRFCFNIREGALAPLHTSAPGKALVAFLPERQRAAIMDGLAFKRFTANTITDRAAYRKQLAQIRRQGYATDIGEESPSCHCGGVPILGPEGESIAAFYVSGMRTRLAPDVLLANIRVLQEAARKTEKRIAEHFRAARPDREFSPCVAEALRIIREKACGAISLPALARRCGASYSSLRTLFRKETGSTLHQYHIRLRIEAVRKMLSETNRPITEIAELAGFFDQKHLSGIFKRKTGISPLKYRQGLRRPDGKEREP